MPIYFYSEPPTLKYRIVVNTINFFQSKYAVQRDLMKNKYPIPSYNIYKSVLKYKIQLSSKVSGFDVHHVSNSEPQPMTVLYLHGGGHISGSMKIHYDFLNKLIDVLNVNVVIPDYPLVPDYTYQDTLQMIEETYLSMLQDYPDHQIVLMGDSAGGSLSLALYLKLKQLGKRLPDKVVVISPCLDAALDHPDIVKYLQIEPILKDLDGIHKIGEIYTEGDYKNPLVSPYYGDFSGIKDLNIFIGTNDILYPDCEKFRQKLEKNKIPNKFFVYQNMCHCWMLYNDFEESKHAFAHIQNILQCEENTALV